MKNTFLFIIIFFNGCAAITTESVVDRGRRNEVIYEIKNTQIGIKNSLVDRKFDPRNEPDWAETGICWRF